MPCVFVVAHSRSRRGVRKDPVPSGAAAEHARADVGLQRRGRAHRERGAAGRALLLRQPRRGQERRYAER